MRKAKAQEEFAAIIAEDFNDEPTFAEKVKGVLNLAIHYAGNRDKHGMVAWAMPVELASFTEMCEFVCMLPKPIEIDVHADVWLGVMIEWEHTTVGGRRYTIALSARCPL